MPIKKNDALRYIANLIGLAALSYFATYYFLRLPAQLVLTLFHKSATLQNPIAVPEWVMALINLVLTQAPLALACAVLYFGRMPHARPRLSFARPRDARLWLFTPVFLGFGLLCNIITTLFARFLSQATAYTPPAPGALPDSAGALGIYFIALCVVPAVLEEILVRGLMQGMLVRYGPWFGIIVSSVLFTLLHTNIVSMPGIFALSLVLGLCAWCTGSILPGMILHFCNNVVAFFITLTQQKADFAPMRAMTVYLIIVITVAAFLCLALIITGKIHQSIAPVPHFHDPKNRQSRFERLVTAPVFLGAMVFLTLRALMPLFFAPK
ncbi:MAG: CPBP family intramembrane metalloprotease [Oscillospiraceae bacterium]|nr:CPBP family intramembrane metalloprotease [Oscillospiraceae bacterium]